MIRKWDIKDELVNKKCIEEIIARIDEQKDANFGIIAAQEIIDIVAKYLGPQSYNTGLEDAKKLILSKISDLEFDIDLLKIV